MALREKIHIGLMLLGSALCTAATLPGAPPVPDVRSVLPPVGANLAVHLSPWFLGERVPVPPPEWVAPTSGEMTSGFGERWGSMHNGVDIANDIGTPVRAGSAGTVVDSGPASGYGMWVRIAHSDDVVSVYGHIDQTFVSVGQQVRAGEVIATMGDRGQSTGPHLHFQLEVGGNPIDPVRFYRDAAAELLG
ncbi:hypothetical protein GCM10011581_00350 [Saccharopolyspora subtropica]|uniref:M23ase beta-sheet core domain-containing protein n=1 Tax=Saccharopolyspora thermophila TaxID=89367 RepID=A0A917N7J5_9PSEU|nr:M23 family metallopeptidase [Saccharopolyspora subtropica]GGI67452.1 hypothetical protein GCM10011581_00350 [Saccharopolyspora subtropica]